jgi:hypothetical protein
MIYKFKFRTLILSNANTAKQAFVLYWGVKFEYLCLADFIDRFGENVKNSSKDSYGPGFSAT